ncbi:hypothetical protein CC77DRAFT_1020921 [Alternaria alternata]|uniref:Uncharacterized protein n=2 Tax=Alternaria alternata complex TaxID=187734 RepID=A0A177DMH5_ALTAL|nr:hypothetical protein CC77DRAFT_1020921 [Alternaria alternata]XP_051591334.1 uncharacterized protein J4E82_002516 [Alternaria postmessia]RYN52520.1 hypothetical protein AA0118_g10132 [Alternaria tenuissima]KAH6861846.1 hypothetical protein B0T12DRAFT_480539 [Alternaria alternata]KAI5378631.1 hypothetical protein J4E82_002516 [Alternaria postmessia]OAG20430.1 hypothetical protein CC77DRAFT_1020921 [Alternaria alternata]RYN67449.1 hypothetical protein AA0117_g11533 [Alternaria alternata]
MKFALISTVIYTATVLAAPGAISLSRSFKTISVRDDNNVEGTSHIACVECPCEGFSGDCKCVNNGCCCDMTNPGQPPAGGW